MLKDPSARKTLQVYVKAHNLDLIALNANGNKLHSTEGKKQSEDLYNTIRLAGKFGVKTVVLIHYRPKVELSGPCRTREDYQLLLKSEQDTA